MMIKFLTIIAVFFTSVYTSRYFSKSLTKRLEILNGYYRDICIFKQMAVKQNKDVIYIFEALSRQSDGLNKVYAYIYDALNKRPYLRADSVFYEAINAYDSGYLQKEDQQIMSSFSSMLSALRSVQSKQSIDQYTRDLAKYISAVKDDLTIRIKLYQKFGIIMGLFFGILLI
jgi:stage III sporulation protein AB